MPFSLTLKENIESRPCPEKARPHGHHAVSRPVKWEYLSAVHHGGDGWHRYQEHTAQTRLLIKMGCYHSVSTFSFSSRFNVISNGSCRCFNRMNYILCEIMTFLKKTGTILSERQSVLMNLWLSLLGCVSAAEIPSLW